MLCIFHVICMKKKNCFRHFPNIISLQCLHYKNFLVFLPFHGIITLFWFLVPSSTFFEFPLSHAPANDAPLVDHHLAPLPWYRATCYPRMECRHLLTAHHYCRGVRNMPGGEGEGVKYRPLISRITGCWPKYLLAAISPCRPIFTHIDHIKKRLDIITWICLRYFLF